MTKLDVAGLVEAGAGVTDPGYNGIKASVFL
jgi:hypothetical protein